MEKIKGMELIELDFKNIEEPTYMECLFAVEEDPNNIQYVPPQFQDYELCLVVAKKDPSLLKYVTNLSDERVENLMPRENKIVEINVIEDFITTIPKIIIYYQDLKDGNKIHYIDGAEDCEIEIYQYIKEIYGDKCLAATIKQKNNGGELEGENGIIYECCNGKYNVYKKTTQYTETSGWFYGSTKVPVSFEIELIRVYGLDYK